MRVISVGKVLPEGSSFETDSGFEADSHFSIPGGPLLDQMRRETANAWGFIAEVAAEEPVSTSSFAYQLPGGEIQIARQLSLLEPGVIGFFVQNYRPGDSLFFNGAPVSVPDPGPLDGRLPAYISPSSEASQRRDSGWKCLKCGGTESASSEFRGSSGGFTAYMNWDDSAFRVVSCSTCGFSEFYKKW